MLILPIKKKWFDMILSGEKKTEYREIKPYWDLRIARCCMNFVRKEYVEIFKKRLTLRCFETTTPFPVLFKNGYGKNAPSFTAECTLSIDTGKPEWGAVEGVEYYCFHIRRILNCQTREQTASDKKSNTVTSKKGRMNGYPLTAKKK